MHNLQHFIAHFHQSGEVFNEYWAALNNTCLLSYLHPPYFSQSQHVLDSQFALYLTALLRLTSVWLYGLDNSRLDCRQEQEGFFLLHNV